jgi:prevent-host-death family protein
MSSHSIAEAESRLSELVDRALQGEAVVITRDGRPVAELRPMPVLVEAGPVDATEALTLLDRLRLGRLDPEGPDAGTLGSRLRDEDWL